MASLGSQGRFHEGGNVRWVGVGLVWKEGRPPRQKDLHIQYQEVGRSLLHTREIDLEKEGKSWWELSLIGCFSLCFNQGTFYYKHIITWAWDTILPWATRETEEMGDASALTCDSWSRKWGMCRCVRSNCLTLGLPRPGEQITWRSTGCSPHLRGPTRPIPLSLYQATLIAKHGT